MRILAMVHLAPPRHCAGAEMMLVSMLRPLAEAGHTVDMLLSRETPDTAPYDLHGITVHPHRGRNDPWPFVEAADVVITHLENTARAGALCAILKRPLIQVLHNTHPTTKAFLASSTSLAVYNSQWMAEDFADTFTGRSLIVRPPVFAADYVTTPGDAVTLINLNEAKGADTFYALAERMPDVAFLGVEGAYGEQNLRTDLPNVTLLSHGQDMRGVYARTRLLLMPSSYESWGRVGVEAMCSGIPVIAHPTPGLREALGEAGTFADRDDTDAWQAAVRGLLDGRRYKAAAKRARARAAELDPTDELTRWCAAVEYLGGHRGA